MDTFLTFADQLAADIASGRLRPGDRLPPHRTFADQRGIAVSTAGRVYAELVRRGLVSGEVGRGTYVRAVQAPAGIALAEPSLQPIDLELNFPSLPQQAEALSKSLGSLLRTDAFDYASRPVGVAATPGAREAVARFLARGTWTPDASSLLFAGNGKQAIVASLSALASAGHRIAVEALTYPLIKGMAQRLGIELVPIALDDEGMRADQLARAHRSTPLAAVYLQTALHNPLGISMSDARRRAIAGFLHSSGLFAIEDAVYSFLTDDEPLAAMAPDRTIWIDSLSKRLAPGLTVGFISAPADIRQKISHSIRAGAWGATGFAIGAALQWIGDGTASAIAAGKRADARERQRVARRVLRNLRIKADPRAYHLWIELPEHCHSERFTATAAKRGIAVTPASAFSMEAGRAPNAVRLALGSPSLDALEGALKTLRELILSDDPFAGTHDS